jgi:hypothetical protein
VVERFRARGIAGHWNGPFGRDFDGSHAHFPLGFRSVSRPAELPGEAQDRRTRADSKDAVVVHRLSNFEEIDAIDLNRLEASGQFHREKWAVVHP